MPRGFRQLTIAGAAALGLAAGCSSGGEGDAVGFGTGQNPDPVVLDFPIVYVKRPVPVDGMGAPATEDVREVLTFNVGADLYFRDRASPSTPDINVTGAITDGLGDIRDVTVSFDAQKVAFAMRAQFIEGADDDEQPTWNIWEYDIPGRTLRRVISSEITAEAGHDIAPQYLPDGRLLFSSTRQRRSVAILIDEGKPQFAALDEDRNEPAFVLHTMQPDGSGIEQIGFNQSHDLNPLVLDDGSVIFSRWDNAGPNDEINLYRMNPDGSALELLYGAQSHDVDGDGAAEQFLQPQVLPNGNLVALLKPFVGTSFGGDIVEIDVSTYVENTQPTALNAGMPGPAQIAATVNAVVTDPNSLSPGGRFRSVYPLRDGTDRMLVSWSQCRLQDADGRILPCTDTNLADPLLDEAPPLYGIWIYDQRDDTQLPVVPPDEGFVYSDVVAAEPRPVPPVIFDGSEVFALDAGLADEGAGVINIRSVYDVLGVDTAPGGIDTLADPAQATAAERPARFLRIVKAVSMPDDDLVDVPNSAFGRSAAQGMREIVGYAMIEPDGSVIVKVPANVALALSVLDADGRRISQRHQNWLQVVPGQALTCNGCHDRNSGLSHGRQDAFDSVHDGATTTGLPYPNTNALYFADFGETMAEARARQSCTTDCAAIDASPNVRFEDVWTDEVAAGRAADATFAYDYGDLQTPAPTTAACLTRWTPACRITIHYEDHIHPLWALPRQDAAAQDVTCTGCHTDRDAAGMQQVPVAQLDLTDGASDQNADHFKAYRELLFGDNELELVMGALQDRLVENGIDPVTMQPIFVTVPVAPSMSVAGANASGRFFDRFEAGGTHDGYLTPAELRLLSEWLDIGGQYYNDPFVVPQD